MYGLLRLLTFASRAKPVHIVMYRLRKVFMEGAHLASIGENVDLTYPTEHLGDGPEALAKVVKGSYILKRLQEAKHPAVIVGPGILNRPDRAAVLQQVGYSIYCCLGHAFGMLCHRCCRCL